MSRHVLFGKRLDNRAGRFVRWLQQIELYQLFIMAFSGDKFSILLPTYNEKENLPLITYMLTKHLNKA